MVLYSNWFFCTHGYTWPLSRPVKSESLRGEGQHICMFCSLLSCSSYKAEYLWLATCGLWDGFHSLLTTSFPITYWIYIQLYAVTYYIIGHMSQTDLLKVLREVVFLQAWGERDRESSLLFRPNQRMTLESWRKSPSRLWIPSHWVYLEAGWYQHTFVWSSESIMN